MKGQRKRQATATSTRKQRILLTIILASVIVIILVLFIVSHNKPLQSKPPQFGFLGAALFATAKTPSTPRQELRIW